jgi:predicted GTPase
MEKRDYAIGALLACIIIITVILASYSDEIKQLQRDVTTLNNRIEIIESYNFEHSKIE